MKNPFLLLQSFLGDDNPNGSLPLLNDEHLLSVVNAWSKIRVLWEPPNPLEEVPISSYDLWDELWQYAIWDIDELAMASGLTDTMAFNCFLRAKVFRLIYPDGSISPSASRVIALIIGATLGKMADDASSVTGGSKKDGRKKSEDDFDGDV